MKRPLTTAIYFITPAALSGAFVLLSYVRNPPPNVWEFFTAFCYMAAVCGICYFAVYRPFNHWLLPACFVSTPVLPYIFEFHIAGGWRFWLVTWIVLIFYTIPFVIISAAVAVVFALRDRRKRRDGGSGGDSVVG